MVKSKLSSFAHIEEDSPTPVLTPSQIMYDGDYIAKNDKETAAREIVHKNMLYSLGILLIPFPVIDLAFTVGVQVNMIRDLSELYKIPFSNHAAKNLILSLAGGIGSLLMGRVLFISMVKMLPFGYPLAALAANPAASGAVTYALGNVFIMHFEAGGTLLDLDPHKMKEFFFKEFKNGIEYSKKIQP